ncbi:MAG: restriction endonuclease subunit R, partial [Bacteroidetes bacterium]
MSALPNQDPEQLARDQIDQMLEEAGWVIQSKKRINLHANRGVAIREYLTDAGEADYALFVNAKAVGIIEAKREEEGFRITTVEEQSTRYAKSKLKYLNNEALPFVYESTGIITHFTDYRDPKPRARTVFGFHRPETLANWLKKEKPLRARLLDLPKRKPIKNDTLILMK